MKDLGYANGWGKTPQEVKDCEHDKELKYPYSNVIQYTCKICGFTYKVDSSG